jgi:hypothetical protein
MVQLTLNGLKERSWSCDNPSGSVTGTLWRGRVIVRDMMAEDEK